MTILAYDLNHKGGSHHLARECHPERLLHSQATAPKEWVLQVDLVLVNGCAKDLPELRFCVRRILREGAQFFLISVCRHV